MTFEEKYNTLTPRQREIYHLLVTEHRQKEISTILGIKVKTVKYHTTNIYQKFGVKGRLQLIMASYEPLYPEKVGISASNIPLPLGKPKVIKELSHE